MSGNSAIKINNIQVKTYPDANDAVVSWSSVSNLTVLIPVSNIFNGTNNSLQVSNLVLSTSNTPINSVQNTVFGQMWTDGNYLYVGTDNNVIKRIALSPF